MRDLLNKLGKEEEQSENKELKIDDNLNARLDLMVKSFEKGFEHYPAKVNFQLYNLFGKIIDENIELNSQEELTMLPFRLAEYQWERGFDYLAGLYLSALINKSKYYTHTISTKSFSKRINFLGYENCKNLVVDGDVGLYFAFKMECGKITLNGSCLNRVGLISFGGQIYLNGDFGAIPKTAKVEIYHEGKLIFKEGKPINPKDFEYDEVNKIYIPK